MNSKIKLTTNIDVTNSQEDTLALGADGEAASNVTHVDGNLKARDRRTSMNMTVSQALERAKKKNRTSEGLVSTASNYTDDEESSDDED